MACPSRVRPTSRPWAPTTAADGPVGAGVLRAARPREEPPHVSRDAHAERRAGVEAGLGTASRRRHRHLPLLPPTTMMPVLAPEAGGAEPRGFQSSRSAPMVAIEALRRGLLLQWWSTAGLRGEADGAALQHLRLRPRPRRGAPQSRRPLLSGPPGGGCGQLRRSRRRPVHRQPRPVPRPPVPVVRFVVLFVVLFILLILLVLLFVAAPLPRIVCGVALDYMFECGDDGGVARMVWPGGRASRVATAPPTAPPPLHRRGPRPPLRRSGAAYCWRSCGTPTPARATARSAEQQQQQAAAAAAGGSGEASGQAV